MTKISIDIENSKKQFITESISYGYRDIADRVKMDNLTTHNGMFQFVWNYIDAQLRNGKTNLFVRNLPRGGWKTILIIDPDTMFCYCLMSEDRFSDVKRDKLKRMRTGREHYTDALVLFRNFIDENVNKAQISLFDNVPLEKWNNKVDELQSKIIDLVGKEIEQFVLVTFKRDNTFLTDIHARILNENFEDIIEAQCWSNYIPVEYPEDIQYNNSPVAQEDLEPLAKLKKSIIIENQ